MEARDERRCPWCAEPVAFEARRCPHCASRIEGGVRDPREWHRGHPERKLAGVCAAVADNLGVSVSLVRAGFLLLAFFHGVGLFLYAALWAVMPSAPGEPSGADRVLSMLRGLFDDEPRPPVRRERNGHGDGTGRTGRSHREGSSDAWSPTRS